MLKIKDKYDYRRELCEALRSGKYIQVRGSDPGELPNEACAIRVFAMINDMWGSKGTSGQWIEGCLPYDGFTRVTGINSMSVYSRNDGGYILGKYVEPYTFQELADWIESQP